VSVKKFKIYKKLVVIMLMISFYRSVRRALKNAKLRYFLTPSLLPEPSISDRIDEHANTCCRRAKDCPEIWDSPDAYENSINMLVVENEFQEKILARTKASVPA